LEYCFVLKRGWGSNLASALPIIALDDFWIGGGREQSPANDCCFVKTARVRALMAALVRHPPPWRDCLLGRARTNEIGIRMAPGTNRGGIL
jgi:hypothetical protein